MYIDFASCQQKLTTQRTLRICASVGVLNLEALIHAAAGVGVFASEQSLAGGDSERFSEYAHASETQLNGRRFRLQARYRWTVPFGTLCSRQKRMLCHVWE